MPRRHLGPALSPAATALRTALRENPQASAPERLWSLTRLAETEERRGEFTAAEAAFREALAVGLPDVYLQAAYADFLLDRGRPAEVLALLLDSCGVWKRLTQRELIAYSRGQIASSHLKIGRLLI